MATETPVLIKSYTAGEDLSSSQYKFVKFSDERTVIECDGATDIPCGVLQNAPANGGAAVVMHVGITKVQADAALTSFPTLLGTSADGQADAKVAGTDTTQYVCGQLVGEAAAAGQLATMLLTGTPFRAA